MGLSEFWLSGTVALCVSLFAGLTPLALVLQDKPVHSAPWFHRLCSIVRSVISNLCTDLEMDRHIGDWNEQAILRAI